MPKYDAIFVYDDDNDDDDDDAADDDDDKPVWPALAVGALFRGARRIGS
jgi:MYXO-CTERM domain-containing protein